MNKNKRKIGSIIIILVALSILSIICYIISNHSNINKNDYGNTNNIVNTNNNEAINKFNNYNNNSEVITESNANIFNTEPYDNSKSENNISDDNTSLIFNELNHSNPDTNQLMHSSNILLTNLFNIPNNYEFLIHNIETNFNKTDADTNNLAYLLYIAHDKSILNQDNAKINFVSINNIEIINNTFEYCIYRVNINCHIRQEPMQEGCNGGEFDKTSTWQIKISRDNKIMSIKKYYD